MFLQLSAVEDGFPVNTTEFAALEEVEFRVKDDAAGGAAEFEELLLPGGVGKDRQAMDYN